MDNKNDKADRFDLSYTIYCDECNRWDKVLYASKAKGIFHKCEDLVGNPEPLPDVAEHAKGGVLFAHCFSCNQIVDPNIELHDCPWKPEDEETKDEEGGVQQPPPLC